MEDRQWGHHLRPGGRATKKLLKPAGGISSVIIGGDEPWEEDRESMGRPARQIEETPSHHGSENWQRNKPTCAEELRSYLSQRCGAIKQLYANWENGFLTDRKLVAQLQAEGVPVSEKCL